LCLLVPFLLFSQPDEELTQVHGQGHLKPKRLACDRVDETQFGCMQGQSWRSARVSQGSLEERPIVDSFSTNWVSQLGEVDANLVRSPGLQLALEDGKIGELFDGTDMSNRSLADIGQGRTPAAAVATVANQVGLDSLRFNPTNDHRQVTAMDRVLAELPPQMAFRLHRAREHHQAAGLAIQAMDRTQPG
jgi:hypothetical protein